MVFVAQTKQREWDSPQPHLPAWGWGWLSRLLLRAYRFPGRVCWMMAASGMFWLFRVFCPLKALSALHPFAWIIHTEFGDGKHLSSLGNWSFRDWSPKETPDSQPQGSFPGGQHFMCVVSCCPVWVYGRLWKQCLVPPRLILMPFLVLLSVLLL